VIPVLGRHAALRRTLEHLERQDVRDFEVVLVSDAADPDPQGVQSEARDRRFTVRTLHAEVPGASAARNLGWRSCAAPLVLFLGSDILAGRALVAEHLALHARHRSPSVAVLGHVHWAGRRTTFMRWLDRGFQFDFGSIEGGEAGWGRLYAANMSLKRELLERVGGFDDELPYLYEDLDLGYRLDEVGFRLLYNPRASAAHLHRPSLQEWRTRMETAAVAERAFCARHPDVEPFFFNRFREAVAHPRARGRGALLAPLVPPGLPVLGARVWASVDMRYRQELAPSFLAAWDRAERAGGAAGAQ